MPLRFFCRLQPGRLLPLLFFSLTLGPGSLPAQTPEFKESYSARGQVYGLTYDGQNFWYSQPSSRKVFRIDAAGRSQGFYLGNRQIYGLQFNLSDGLIYVGSEKEILKVSPNTGSIVGRQSIGIEKIAGLDFQENLWYILEKDTGIIHYYDPGLGRTISTFATGVADARDLTINRNAFWITDGQKGQILRFQIEDRRLTGTIRSPSEARGLSFTRNQLWVVNRDKQNIERLSYSDSVFYITSDEFRHRVQITVSFPLLQPGRVHVLQAPNSVYQTVRNAKTKDKSFKEGFLASGLRSFQADLQPGSHTFSYEALITSRNANYLVPESFPQSNENLASSPARHYFTNAALYEKADPVAVLKQGLRGSEAENQDRLQKAGLPVRRAADSKRDARGNYSPPEPTLQVYLRGLGWLPLTGALGPLAFSRTTDQIELYADPTGNANARSAVYVQDGDNFRAVEAQVKVELVAL